METVLITGSNGFIGRNLIEYIDTHCNYEILNPSRSELDLRNEDSINEYLLLHRPNYIIHLAALAGGLPFNKENPTRLISDNLRMNLNLLDSIQLVSSLNKEFWDLKKVVCLGTICQYPHTPPNIPFREEDLFSGFPEPTNGYYGMAKSMMMLHLRALRAQYEIPGIYLLVVNNYGKYDHFFDIDKGHVIPNLIRKFDIAKENKEPYVELFGDGSPTREFLYAEETARAIILAMERYDNSEPINIGNGQEVSIKELAETIKELIGYEGEITWSPQYGNGQPRRVLDVSKAKSFGFENQVSLKDGLKETIKNYYELKRSLEW